jgi:CubicO group peptidase (beta-lactamase class C family)
MTTGIHPARPAPAGPSAVRAVIADRMTRHHVPGLTIAVADSQRLLYAEGFGSSDLAAGRSADADTRYPWFSMSKIATATAVMRLVDDGLLDLDTPVRTLLPTFAVRGDGTEPRLRDLLSHTAGLRNPLPLRWVLPGTAPDTDVDAFTQRLLIRHARTRRPAGGPARYSNIGYLVLAEIVARTTGSSFEDHVRTAVLDPAGMTASGYTNAAGTDTATGYVRLPRVATPLLRAGLPSGIVGGRSGAHVAFASFRVAGAGYGGLIGSAVDAARLLRLHLADGVIDGHRVLRPETARRMRQIVHPGRPFDLGLGWFRPSTDRSASPAFVEHWGTGGGFWNAMRLYPDLDLGVVTMANTTRAYEHGAVMDAVRSAFRP